MTVDHWLGLSEAVSTMGSASSASQAAANPGSATHSRRLLLRNVASDGHGVFGGSNGGAIRRRIPSSSCCSRP